jgi:hypothetical protein
MSQFWSTQAVWSVTDDRYVTPRVYVTRREALADATSTHPSFNPKVTRHGVTRLDRTVTPVSLPKVDVPA